MPSTEPRNRTRAYWAAAAIVAAAWLTLAFPWLSGQFTVPWDAKAHFQPQLQFLADSLHRGEAPFWNPYVFAGSPQIADPQSLIFSLPHLVLAALVPSPGFIAGDLVAFAMLLLGGLAILVVFHDRGWHPAGAAVAAIGFAFGASAAWRIQHTGQVLSLAWWGIAFLCLDRALRRSSLGWGLAAGVTAGCMVLGRDQVALIGVYLLAGYLVWFLARADRPLRALGRALGPLSAGTVGGVLVVTVPIVMTLLLAGDSNRPMIDYEGAARGSLPPASLLTLWSANLFGVDGPLADYWGPPSLAWGKTDLYLARNMIDLYGGAIPLAALLAWGIAQGALAARPIRFFVIAAALLLLYALGRYTPIFALLFHLPGADLYRRPSDASFLIGAVLAILAGYSIHRGLAGNMPRLRSWPAVIAALLVTGGLVIGAVVALAKQQWAIAARPLAISTVTMVAAVAALILARRVGRASPIAATALLATVLTVDLAVNNGPNESTALPPAMFDVLRPDSANATIALLRTKLAETAAPDRRDRVELAGIDFHWPNASMTHRLDNTLGYNPVRLDLYSRATGAQDHVALPEQRTFSPLFPSYRSLLADMLGLRFIATRIPVDQMDKALRPGDLTEIARTPDGFVYENPRALPRVLFVPHAQTADFNAILASGQWPDFDPRQTVLLANAPAGPASGSPGTATLGRYGHTEVIVRASSPGGGYVVLNDVWHPWWRAEVDGKPAPLLRANVLFRAVAVPPGEHTVRFVFRPLTGALEELAEQWKSRQR
jgi:hypothetical protein